MEMQHKFVEFMPETIEEGIVYISVKYGSVIHLCACGCKEEVNTPLSPTDWELNFNGKSMSLSPSIGNWSYDCRSHYWIKDNKAIWAESWSDEQVRLKREYDKQNQELYYQKNNVKDINTGTIEDTNTFRRGIISSWWKRFVNFFRLN